MYGETFCYLARKATATDAKVIKRLTEAKLVLCDNTMLTQLDHTKKATLYGWFFYGDLNKVLELTIEV